jgi:succinate dehydrogenase / fumarate reductase membrane anchor subunit
MDSDPGYRTPLRRAKGLGSAKHGVEVWITERVTSLALIPLTLWGVYSVLVIARGGYSGATDWLQNPFNVTAMVLLLGVAFHHTEIGMRVIIEDYIAKPSTKFVLLMLNKAVAWSFGGLAIFSVLKVAFAGLGTSI